MNYENLDYDGVPWEAGQTLKKAILKPGQELREMTICTRTYSLAYSKNGVYRTFLFHDGIPLRKGYDETKNEWSFFRKSKQGLNAQEWHHVCHILVIKIYFLICFDLSARV